MYPNPSLNWCFHCGLRGKGTSVSSATPSMEAMVVKRRWFSSGLHQQQVQTPQIKDDEVLISVSAAGVNRDEVEDVAKSSNGVCPGLECSGIIVGIGKNVHNWQVGERVCAILNGGGYAEQVVVPSNLLLPLPDNIDLDDAAGLPYASCSIWLALSKMCKSATLQDKSILIGDGTSEIGALAIQYAKYKGLRVIVSTECKEDFAICYHYGADLCISNTEKRFVELVESHNNARGVDFVLDYGASNIDRNIRCCRYEGKVLIINLHGKKSNLIDLSYLVWRHIRVKVFDVRNKSLDYKASLIRELLAHLWPAILQQKVVPVIHKCFSMKEASKAHALLKKNGNVGKIILHNDFGMKEMKTQSQWADLQGPK